MIIPCNSTNPRPFKFVDEGKKRTDYFDEYTYCVNTTAIKFNNDRNYANFTSF